MKMAEKSMECVAIIPARGGSKGIPGKNLRRVAGIPLVAYAIRAARSARSISRVVVSTDSDSIAAVAQAEGAEVIRRPAELSGDTASSESALLHALEYLETSEGYRPHLVVFLQCTSPLTRPDDIDAAVATLQREQADTVFTASRFHGFLWRKDEQGAAQGVNHDQGFRPRRQDRSPEFLENGAVYVMKADAFRKARNRFFGKTVISEMPPERSLEIDEPADLDRVADGLARQEPAMDLLRRRLAERPIKALVMDFDGVLTDNLVVVNARGNESVVCSRADGLGLARLRGRPLQIVVLSAEENPVVAARCAKLQLECRQGIADKAAALENWCREKGITPAEVLFVGNDVNDLECLERAGIGVIPSDAHPAVLSSGAIRLRRPGGRGAVREICDALDAHFTANGGASHG